MLIYYLMFTVPTISLSVKLIFRWPHYQINHKELSTAAAAAFQQSRAEAAVGNSALPRAPLFL